MSLALHRQLIRGIRGLSPARMMELQAFLSRSAPADERSDTTDSATAEPQDASPDEVALDQPGGIAGFLAQDAALDADAGDPEAAIRSCPAGGDLIELDLPQPDCSQDQVAVGPAYGWGPPPLVAVRFDVIGCLIREANEARNARRQRFGL